MLTNWDTRWFTLAKTVSTYSKDPSTQVGSVIAKGNEFISFGYNGFPNGIADDSRLLNKKIKHKMVLHSEENALHHAGREETKGASIYVYPLNPCSKCAANIIQRGIKKVVYQKPTDEHALHWDYDLSIRMFHEAGIETIEVIKTEDGYKSRYVIEPTIISDNLIQDLIKRYPDYKWTKAGYKLHISDFDIYIIMFLKENGDIHLLTGHLADNPDIDIEGISNVILKATKEYVEFISIKYDPVKYEPVIEKFKSIDEYIPKENVVEILQLKEVDFDLYIVIHITNNGVVHTPLYDGTVDKDIIDQYVNDYFKGLHRLEILL